MEERTLLTLVFSSLVILTETIAQKHAIEIYSLHVDCKVTSRFAHTVITSKIANRASESREATFEVELPKTAFITNFSMSIDGKIYPGIIKEKASAQKEYDTAISRGQSAGLVKITGRKLEQFHVSVSIAATSKVTFELMYEELLKRQLGKFELLIKVQPKQLVKHFQIDVHIFEPQGIRFLETDSTFMTNELTEALTKVQNETKAHILFKPTVEQQKINPEVDETLLNGDFVVRYDVKRVATAGDIQIVNGYFVHYFAPHEMPAFPKNVIFVIDRSGSMAGRKIEQTRAALLKILQDLHPEDHFSFITFNSKVVEWKSSLLQATAENVASATGFMRTLSASGGTDINRALLTAVSLLDKAEKLPERSVSMIILLTDGQPTSGENNVEVIQENIQNAINGKYALFCLGFGFDVSYKFLEKMALSNGGIARRIYENSDAALQLQGFYQEVATPTLMKIEMQYPENAVEGLTKNNFKLFFEGSELIVSGKISNELDLLPVEIKAQSHASDLTLKEEANVKEKEQVFQNQSYIFGNFIERLWAYLTIQQLLEKSISAQEEDQKALEAQALELSLLYSFVTPLTSMVVTKPTGQQQMELVNKPTEADNEKPSSFPVGDAYRLSSRSPPGRWHLESSSGSNKKLSSVVARLRDITRAQPLANEYPQLLLQLPKQNEIICLNTDGKARPSVHLLSDVEQGLTVMGKLGDKRNHFVQFEILYVNPPVRIHVSTVEILLSHNNESTRLPWTESATSSIHGLRVSVEKERSVTASLSDTVTVKISFVKFPDDFLGLYFLNTDRFSDKVSGVLGQFYSKAQFENNSKINQRADERLLSVSGSEHRVTRQYKKDYRLESTTDPVPCWSIHVTP
ncbi:inter-alpha-trypsin inhibitor heavy chain family, member 4, transcript variant X1 [Columba livia]|uniref:Inter-alpha-trypsin inhibitor heavy chain family, member 4, transcript variant X1 n=1 Tax=Columba livia TaxID=8932 RepID=A0A2I0LSM0_COLLI|nr:inter-alpha-trypsin inhibitor heavy chain H4 isoform X1 [Columba livia]PKK20427.1 inter-alpha-trypsin inhibitor heavy chain family, member 4, transcript variant X1 [Columba livia]